MRKKDERVLTFASAFRGQGATVDADNPRYLLVGVDSFSVPVILKDGKNPLTPDQVRWHREWRGSKAIVRDLKDVGIVVRAIRGLAGREARKKGDGGTAREPKQEDFLTSPGTPRAEESPGRSTLPRDS